MDSPTPHLEQRIHLSPQDGPVSDGRPEEPSKGLTTHEAMRRWPAGTARAVPRKGMQQEDTSGPQLDASATVLGVTRRRGRFHFGPRQSDREQIHNPTRNNLKMHQIGQPRWLSGLAPPSAGGWDPGDPRPSPTSGMEPASPSDCVSASLSLCLS